MPVQDSWSCCCHCPSRQYASSLQVRMDQVLCTAETDAVYCEFVNCVCDRYSAGVAVTRHTPVHPECHGPTARLSRSQTASRCCRHCPCATARTQRPTERDCQNKKTKTEMTDSIHVVCSNEIQCNSIQMSVFSSPRANVTALSPECRTAPLAHNTTEVMGNIKSSVRSVNGPQAKVMLTLFFIEGGCSISCCRSMVCTLTCSCFSFFYA